MTKGKIKKTVPELSDCFQMFVLEAKDNILKGERKMAHQVVDITCPGCGARVSTGQTQCPYCRGPVVITTFNSVYSMPMPEVNKYAAAYRKNLAEDPDNQDLNTSVAMCYLKLGMYDKAAEAFDKALENNFDNSEAFFYAAICRLGGKKAFIIKDRSTINKIEEYIQAALMIEELGIYYYFWAYIKYDYYKRKFLNTAPTWQELLEKAQQIGLSPTDVEQLYAILKVDRPSCL